MESSEIYEKEYMPYIVKWGKITCWIGLLIVFVPTFVLMLGFGAKAPLEPTISGIVAILSASIVMYFAEPLSIFPAVGTPGLYLVMCSGNSKQIRLPASLVAQDAAEVQQGSPKGGIMSCIGIAVSVLMSTAVLTVMILLGDQLINILPENITKALPMLLPALFGALLVQMSMAHPKEGAIAVGVAVIVRLITLTGIFKHLPLGGGWAPMLLCVFGSIGAVRLYYSMKNKKQKGENNG